MPLRSPGCYTCRKRKIRCDETRPACQRCAIHGVPCPGYRSQPGGVEFRDQTKEVVRRVKGPHQVKQAQETIIIPTTEDNDFDYSFSSEHASSIAATMTWPGDKLLSMLTTPALLNNPLSAAVERNQLHGTFMDIYLPKNSTHLDHFNFFQTIAGMPAQQPALLEGLDTLALVTIGSLHKDRVLLDEAVKMYGRALSSLARAIARPENIGNDELLAAVTIVGMCALYQEIGQHDSAWGKHVRGCQQLISARGASSMQSPLAWLLFTNTRHGALCWALIERKAPTLADSNWRALALNAPMLDSSTLFYDSAIQLPGLLERYDRLGGDDALSLPNVVDLLVDCELLEASLRDWFLDWDVRALLDGRNLYAERPMDDFRTFASLVDDRAIDTAFRFASFPIAYLCSLYWMCMHFLRNLMLSLHRLRHELEEDWYPAEGRAVEASELLDYALNLCRCIPYFCEPESSNTGHVSIFLPMRTAAVYFTTNGHWRLAKWIGSVRVKVFTRGLSPP
ncbi:hypothetical protein BAUCODRAFT_52563, partial [Baudoinia panamericana UAMH 10762]